MNNQALYFCLIFRQFYVKYSVIQVHINTNTIQFIEIIHALCTVYKNPWFINDSFMHDQKQNFCGRGIFFMRLTTMHSHFTVYTRQFCQIPFQKLKLVETWLNLPKLDFVEENWQGTYVIFNYLCLSIYNVLAMKRNSITIENYVKVSKSQKQIVVHILNSSEKWTKKVSYSVIRVYNGAKKCNAIFMTVKYLALN